MKRCYGFCASECISGQCPQALAQSCDWYTDVGFDVPKSCSDCWYNTGQCEDCVFEGSEQCVGLNKDKKIVIEEERIQT